MSEKEIERRLHVGCLVCGATLACPEGKDFWAWLKCGDVLVFNQMHLAHAPNPKMVGAELRFIEKE